MGRHVDIKNIQTALREQDSWVPGASDHVPRLKIDGPRYRTARSKIYYCESDLFPTPVAIKVCRGGESSFEALRTEYAALQQLQSMIDETPPLRVPQTYVLLPSADAFVMEWIPYRSMKRLLWRQTTAKEFKPTLQQAGKWLRAFHQFSGITTGKLPTHELIERSKQAFDRTSPGMRTDTLLRTSCTVLRDYHQQIRDIDLDFSIGHGDFTPANLLCGPGETISLDLRAVTRQATIRDVARFLNYFDRQLLTPGGVRFLPLRAELSHTFTDSYDSGLRDGKAMALTWLRLFMVVNLWVRRISRRRLIAIKPHYYFALRRLARMLSTDLQCNY